MNSLYNAVVDKDPKRQSRLVAEIKGTDCSKTKSDVIYQELAAGYLCAL